MVKWVESGQKNVKIGKPKNLLRSMLREAFFWPCFLTCFLGKNAKIIFSDISLNPFLPKSSEKIKKNLKLQKHIFLTGIDLFSLFWPFFDVFFAEILAKIPGGKPRFFTFYCIFMWQFFPNVLKIHIFFKISRKKGEKSQFFASRRRNSRSIWSIFPTFLISSPPPLLSAAKGGGGSYSKDNGPFPTLSASQKIGIPTLILINFFNLK